MNDEQFKKIIEKIDKLTAIIAIQGKKQDEQIKILTGLGFSSTKIAHLVGTTPENVRQRKFRSKKKTSKTTKDKKGQ